ncbi:hypothetical protein HFO65_33300 [Rhizobium laguerreae]|uniref:hypothetical protein n=1 Tax=Rhizobium TaxID=379 RepID=UPI001C83E382|nr:MULTISPECIES: hypothetical protein [Rhizobium]MBX4905001.1 hypothetical protein [Rhizobium bangladeshense]MBX4925671.1 hypothetical protein [Rhizobium binae]MBX5132292.1 hypothetical protein [Rhizobium lentis]MBX5173438.1 hypothetical protein [Rhizobium sp. NZLR1b]MBX5180456.1 hypothetical protein [Rhizobium lentis]
MPIFLPIVDCHPEIAPNGRNKNFSLAFYVAQQTARHGESEQLSMAKWAALVLKRNGARATIGKYIFVSPWREECEICKGPTCYSSYLATSHGV